MKTLLTLGILIFLFTSCISNYPLVEGKADNNKSYNVDYLFEHEGCKVYRFKDKDKYVYFTNCTGNVTNSTNDSTKTYIQTMTNYNK